MGCQENLVQKYACARKDSNGMEKCVSMSAGQTKSQNVRQDLRCVPLAVRKSIAIKRAEFSVTLLNPDKSVRECACVKKEANTMMKCLKNVWTLLKNVQELKNAQLMKSGTIAEPLVLPSVENHENHSAQKCASLGVNAKK